MKKNSMTNEKQNGVQVENEELVRQIQAGINVSSNLEQLYLQNRPFIYNTARKYSKQAEIDDLMQEGYLGLQKAASMYNPDHETKFITYAGYWIQQSIQRYCGNCGNVKRIPIHQLSEIARYKRFLAQCQSENRNPSDFEICRALNISANKLDNLRKTVFESSVASLQSPVDGADGLLLEDSIPDPSSMEEDVTERFAREYANRVLWNIVDELKDTESYVISGLYRRSKTLRELKDELHISEQRIAQIRDKALQTLNCKKRLEEIASIYGYIPSRAYKGSLSYFNSNGSSTENIALNRIEQQEKAAHLANRIHQNEQAVQQELSLDELFAKVVGNAKRGDAHESFRWKV